MKILKVKDYYLITKMKHFLYFLLVTFFIGCTSNTIYDQPKDLIPKDTMELLLSKVESYTELLNGVKDKIEAKNTVFQAEFHLKDSIKKQKQKTKRKLKKEKDSIRKAQKRKDFIPLILRELKIDSSRFYNIKAIYNPNIKEYNLIINQEVQKDNEEGIVKKKKSKKKN